MSKGFIVGGGGSAPFAFVFVTYPEGSTVTCTNASGKKDISTTQRLFYIKKSAVPFNCVVTATNGASTKTETVSITHEGQGTEVNIEYWHGELFDAGEEFTFITGGWSGTGSKPDNTAIKVSAGAGTGHYEATVNKITIPDGYTVLKATAIDWHNNSSYGGNELPQLVISSNSDLSTPIRSERLKLTSGQQQTIFLSVTAGAEYYIGVVASAGDASSCDATFSKIWLE